MLALEALNKSVISRLLLSQGLLHFSPQLLRHLGFQFADSLHGQRVTIGPRWAQARAITARHHLSMSDIVLSLSMSDICRCRTMSDIICRCRTL
jgi:hypothetical protein